MQIRVKPEDIVEALSGAADASDALSQSELGRVSAISAAEIAALAAESERLKAKYGDQSPQASAAAADVAWLAQERSEMEAQLTRESIPVAPTAADTFVVYGRVLDRNGAGVAAMTVSAVLANGTALGRAKTLENGAFELAVKAPAKSSAVTDAAAAPVPIPRFQLDVSSRKPPVSHLDEEIFEPVLDHMAYREITLDTRVTGK
jgi:hypothetical protein